MSSQSADVSSEHKTLKVLPYRICKYLSLNIPVASCIGFSDTQGSCCLAKIDARSSQNCLSHITMYSRLKLCTAGEELLPSQSMFKSYPLEDNSYYSVIIKRLQLRILYVSCLFQYNHHCMPSNPYFSV